MKTKKLNLGCGNDYRQGWVNVDASKTVKTDVYHDLNEIPYPFKKNNFNEILMKMILEHMRDPNFVLKEVVRIAKNNAKLTIIVPHAFSYSAVTDIQHKTSFTENSFSPELLKEYELENLKPVKQTFLFPENKWKKYIPFKNFLKIFLNGIYDDLLFEFIIKK